MNTARKDCIWHDQCGSECLGRCDDYSPADESVENEAFYRSVLKENAREYEKMIQDYSDRGVRVLNRENRRALKKKLKDKNARTLAADVLGSLGDDINKTIRDSDLVILNVERIMSRREYPRLQEGYRQFVESNRGKVFVAHSYHEKSDGFSNLMELEGVEKWLFWYGDLLRVEKIQAEEGE